MYGISSHGKFALSSLIEDLFDDIALQFIGNIPSLRNKKRLVISSERNFGLAHLFVQAMGNRPPNSIEQDALTGLLESSNGYIESLKNKTRSSITERIDGLVKEAKAKGRKVSQEEVQGVVDEELKKARSSLTAIVEAESTKLRNVGTMMDISKVASSLSDSDPTVFFVVVKDTDTCSECLRLHTVDGVVPRLWKFSELSHGYHKRGDEAPCVSGLHPHCRCTLTYLPLGFSFKDGRVSYHSSRYDAYKAQKK